MATRRIYASVVIFTFFGVTFCVPISDKTTEIKTVNSDKLKHDYAGEIALLKQDIISLQERISKLEDHSADLEALKIFKEITNSTEENPVVHQISKRALRRRLREVAFQASLTKEYISVKLNDAIIFNDVITNIGGAYNKNTGVFTAPVSGTYTFNTNIVAEKGNYVEAGIEVNGKATVSAISDHRIASNSDYLDIWDQGNAVAILKLRRGDKVRVAVQWPQGSHEIHGIGKSSFSGYLLKSHEHQVNPRFFSYG